MITEIERNNIVLKELFGDKEFSNDVIENRLVDWDKAFTCIFYNKKQDTFKNKGVILYDNIRKKNEEFLAVFKTMIEQMA